VVFGREWPEVSPCCSSLAVTVGSVGQRHVESLEGAAPA